MEIVVGTYDEVLIGFRVIKIGEVLQLETNFTDNSHTGCIKCIAISPKGVMASGSTDETIRLLNIKKKKEVGSLMQHSGTITSLEFQKSFLFSTSEDNTLCLWKSLNWECLKTLKGHRYGINCVSVHPSGKLALTVGHDRKLMTWNLITGRSAYITNIKEVAEIVKWTPDGDMYLTVVNNKIDVYSVETAEIKSIYESEARINCVDFYTNKICVYGGEGGQAGFYDIGTHKVIYTCNTGTSRIKGLCITKSPLDDTKKVLITGTSDGKVQIFAIEQEGESITTTKLVEHNASFRITCMAVYYSTTVKPEDEEGTSVEMTDSVIDVSEDEDNLKPVVAKKKRGLEFDDDDLNLVSKSLYDDEIALDAVGGKVLKKLKKDTNKEKSISFSRAVTVEQENDKELKKMKRVELLNNRSKEKRKERKKLRKKLMKSLHKDSKSPKKVTKKVTKKGTKKVTSKPK